MTIETGHGFDTLAQLKFPITDSVDGNTEMIRNLLLGSVCLQESNQFPVCFLQLCQESIQPCETVLINELCFDVHAGIGKVQTTDIITVIIVPRLIDRNLRSAAVTIALFFLQISLIAQPEVFSHLSTGQAECVASLLVVVPTLLVFTARAVFRDSKTLSTGSVLLWLIW